MVDVLCHLTVLSEELHVLAERPLDQENEVAHNRVLLFGREKPRTLWDAEQLWPTQSCLEVQLERRDSVLYGHAMHNVKVLSLVLQCSGPGVDVHVQVIKHNVKPGAAWLFQKKITT